MNEESPSQGSTSFKRSSVPIGAMPLATKPAASAAPPPAGEHMGEQDLPSHVVASAMMGKVVLRKPAARGRAKEAPPPPISPTSGLRTPESL